MSQEKTLKIAVAGCCGRMGQTLIKSVLALEGVTLVAGSERPGFDEQLVNAQLETVGCKNLFITSNTDLLAEEADAVLDFTSPESTLAIAAAVAKRRGIHIVGTTGFSDDQKKELAKFARDARIVQSGNFSLGIHMLVKLVEQAARLLDDSYDIEIFEMHHKHKLDAPSGTALMLGEVAAKARKAALKDRKPAEHTDIPGERKRGDIGFSSLRGGDIVGVHSVMFAGPGEVIELKHQGFSREIYANGAIHAALWASKQKPGFYSMRDVLGLDTKLP